MTTVIYGPENLYSSHRPSHKFCFEFLKFWVLTWNEFFKFTILSCSKIKNLNCLETRYCRVKTVKVGIHWWVVSVYRVLLTGMCLMSFWGHSVYFRFSTIFYLENGWPQSETEWNLGLSSEYSVYTGYFWHLIVLKVILRSFGALPIFDKLAYVSQNRLVLEQNWVKFWPNKNKRPIGLDALHLLD